MIEEQINAEILATHLQRILASDKRKPDSEFQQKVTEMIDQAAFQIPLVRLFGKGEKLEVVRVFDDLLCKLRLRLPAGCE